MAPGLADSTEGVAIAAFILRQEGFTVTDVPASNEEKRADLRATTADGRERYLVEVKTKLDDPAPERELRKHGKHEWEQPMGARSVIQKQIQKAVDQLETTPADGDEDKLIWFHGSGKDAEIHAAQGMATLLGSVDCVDFAERGVLKPAYFADHALLYRYTQVTGAVVTFTQGDEIRANLIVNPFSPRAERFRRNALAKLFAGRNAITDPFLDEAAGRAYVVDGEDLDRKNENAVREFLRAKYGLPWLTLIRMKRYSVGMLVPDSSRKAAT